MPSNLTSSKVRTYGSAAGLVAAGLVAGGVLAASLSANAASPTPSPGTTKPADPRPGDPGRPPRPAETPLTGQTAEKVKAAVLAKYPGATFVRVETDGDGAYEAHITKKDGTHATVKVGKAEDGTVGERGKHGRGPGGPHGGPPGLGAGETPLTGDTLAKVKAAVSAKYPGATFDRVETDRDGVYEAHITKKDGAHVTVKLD